MPRSEPINQEYMDELVRAMASLEGEEECRAFLRDLCTMQELIQLSQRLQVAKRLLAGETYDAIRAQLPVSSTTSIRKGRSRGPRANCCSMVRSRLRIANPVRLLQREKTGFRSSGPAPPSRPAGRPAG